MRYYVSGPMSDIPEYNRPLFNKVAAELRGRGLDVYNPAELIIHDGEWVDFMREDVARLMECHALVLLPGWQMSSGAKAEVYLAHLLKFTIYTYEDGTLRDITQNIFTNLVVHPVWRHEDW